MVLFIANYQWLLQRIHEKIKGPESNLSVGTKHLLHETLWSQSHVVCAPRSRIASSESPGGPSTTRNNSLEAETFLRGVGRRHKNHTTNML